MFWKNVNLKLKKGNRFCSEGDSALFFREIRRKKAVF